MPVLPEVGSISVFLPGVILPCGFQRLDHRHADAVLDAGDRVEEFELGQEVGDDALFLGELVEPDERRVADRLGDRVVDASATGNVGRGDRLVHERLLSEHDPEKWIPVFGRIMLLSSANIERRIGKSEWGAYLKRRACRNSCSSKAGYSRNGSCLELLLARGDRGRGAGHEGRRRFGSAPSARAASSGTSAPWPPAPDRAPARRAARRR